MSFSQSAPLGTLESVNNYFQKEEKKYAEAVLNNEKVPLHDRLQVLVTLGLCCRNLKSHFSPPMSLESEAIFENIHALHILIHQRAIETVNELNYPLDIKSKLLLSNHQCESFLLAPFGAAAVLKCKSLLDQIDSFQNKLELEKSQDISKLEITLLDKVKGYQTLDELKGKLQDYIRPTPKTSKANAFLLESNLPEIPSPTLFSNNSHSSRSPGTIHMSSSSSSISSSSSSLNPASLPSFPQGFYSFSAAVNASLSASFSHPSSPELSASKPATLPFSQVLNSNSTVETTKTDKRKTEKRKLSPPLQPQKIDADEEKVKEKEDSRKHRKNNVDKFPVPRTPHSSPTPKPIMYFPNQDKGNPGSEAGDPRFSGMMFQHRQFSKDMYSQSFSSNASNESRGSVDSNAATPLMSDTPPGLGDAPKSTSDTSLINSFTKFSSGSAVLPSTSSNVAAKKTMNKNNSH